MDENRCSTCAKKLPLSSFLADTSADMTSKVFATCIPCREWSRLKRKAAQPPRHPRRYSRHTSLDYCSRCQHTLPPSAVTSISINPGDNTLKTCSSCQYRSRRDSILPSAIPPLPESSTLANIPPQSLDRVMLPPPVLRPLLPQPQVIPRQVSPPALPRPVPPRPVLPPLRPLLPRPVSGSIVPRQVPPPAPPQPASPLPGLSQPGPSQPTPSQSAPPQPASSRPVSPPAAGFLSAEHWGYIQSFNEAMERVKM